MRAVILPAQNVFQSLWPAAGKQPTFSEVRIHVLRDHYNLGRLVRAGETISLPEPSARDCVALGRGEYT